MSRWQLVKFSPARLRIVVLASAVVLSVGVPFAVLQRAASSEAEATRWVAHSETVKSTLFELVYRLRDMEASAVNAYLHTGDTQPVTNYRTTHEQIGPLFERLAALTADNPAQLERSGAFRATSEGRIHMFDVGMEQLARLDQDEALQSFKQGQKMFRFRELAVAMADEEARLLETRVATAQRSQRNAQWLSVAALLVQFLLLGGMLYLSERQSARRLRAEDSSRSAQLRAQQIVQTIREPLALLDRRLRLVQHNTAFGEFYAGVDAVESGRTLREIGDGAWSDAALLQKLGDVLPHDRELWDYALRQRCPGMADRSVLINARPMPAPDGGEPVILLTVSDITARQHAEDEVRELNRQLEGKIAHATEVNRELEAFSYSVSHDLRAPLRHVAGFADKLGGLLGTQAQPQALHYLEVIGTAARRMSTLIDDLLMYSRLGRHALRLQLVDMQSLVEETRQMLLADVGARQIDWQIGILPSVVGDENMLRQVWQNLIGNAVKYTARRASAQIRIDARQAGEEYFFRVADNGTGFDMQYAGKLFGVFQRLHKHSDFPGTGIGLANVRRIISRHDGRVWAEAEVEVGATFHFSLPLHADGESPLALSRGLESV